jgi:hypothetical protein
MITGADGVPLIASAAPVRRRISSGELFTLADAISKLSGESGHVSQYGAVTEKLNSALSYVLDAAKSVAFQEARDKHIQACSTPNGSQE